MIPTGGDVAIYNARVKSADYRITLGLDYPAWTDVFLHDFSTGIPHEHFRTSWIAGTPHTDASGAHLRNYWDGEGTLVPPFEEIILREGRIPVDPTLPFTVRVPFEVHVEDPFYDQGFAIYGLDGASGAPSDPLRVIFHGSVTFPNFPGTLILYPPGFIPDASHEDLAIPWDEHDTEHEIVVDWDPNRGDRLKLYHNSTEVWSGAGTRPYGFGAGIKWAEDHDVTGGTPGAIETVMTIGEIEVEAVDHEGYETRVRPAFAVEGSGDIDTADDGVMFEDDGETWCKIPKGHIVDFRVEKGLSQREDTFSITLVPEMSDRESLKWRDNGRNLWKHRPILIDTLVESAGGDTGWRREIAGRIERVTGEDNGRVPRITISGRSIPHRKLADTVSAAYVSSAGDHPGLNLNYTFTGVFEDLLDIGDALDGSSLGATPTEINAPDIAPLSLNSGAQELLSNIAEWADRLVQESRVRYSVSGDAKYGEFILNLWDTEPGDSFTFTPETWVSVSFDDDDRRGPGQVKYEPNLSRRPVADWMFYGKPGMALYPTYPYPTHAFTYHDSIAYANSLSVGPIVTFPDRDGGSRGGGIAKLRLYAEISRERQIEVAAVDHNWPEPADTVVVEASPFLDVNETLIVDRVSTRLERRGIVTTLGCFSTDIIGIMTS